MVNRAAEMEEGALSISKRDYGFGSMGEVASVPVEP
jgi:hypothetical protein